MLLKPDYPRRRKNLRQALKQAGMESALITDVTNVTWLTGFTGDSSYLLVLPRSALLISDSRYEVQLDEECPDLDREVRTSSINLPEFTIGVLQKTKLPKLAFEAHKLSKSAFDRFADGLPATTVIAATDLVEPLRAIKDKSEIANIEESIRIAERAFTVIRNQIVPRQTELEIAHNLEHQIRQFGGTRCAFDPIVGVGTRGALPHGRPSAATVDQAPFMLIDWGAQFCGYASDLTRILVTGKISPKLRKLYNIVLNAQQTAIRLIRPGANFQDIDKAARGLISDAGFGKQFGHGLGHGFGLQIHETPFISPVSKGVLEAGMVITVEPGVYLPDWGGIRIEDDVLVTADGHQVLTSLPREIDECIVDIGPTK